MKKATLTIVFFSFVICVSSVMAQDWDISDTVVVEDTTIVMDGNVTVLPGGILTLDNVTLKMNVTDDGQYHIEVDSLGAMYILNGSVITDGDADDDSLPPDSLENARFMFWVRKGATFEMRNSELYECGYPGDLNQSGLFISADSVLIHNNVISRGMFGITVKNCTGGAITNNSIAYNGWSAIFLWQTSHNEVTHNIVHHCAEGISLSDCEHNFVAFNDVSFNTYHGITLMYGAKNNVVHRNTANFNPVNGIFLYNTDSTIVDSNTVRRNGRSGISAGKSYNLTIEASIMDSNYIGMSMGCGHVMHSKLSKNIITDNVYGLNLWGSSDSNSVAGNTIRNNDYGILVLASSNNTINDNIISYNDSVGFYITYQWEDSPIPDEDTVKGISEHNTLTSNTIYANNVGIFLDSASVSTEMMYNTISENTGDGIRCVASTGTNVNHNNITDNVGYGVWNTEPKDTVNAKHNWWGHSTGPYHPTNPGGLGDTLSNYVDFIPWLTEPVGVVPGSPDVAITLAKNDLVLAWSAVTIDTFGAPLVVDLYRIYRDTVAGFQPGSPPFDSTADTSYVDTSGVVGDTGTHYYYSVTAVADGKESESSEQVGEFDKYLFPVK